MRKIAKQREEEGAEIDLTPMLDVVFIMLIFFIVVASFLKEAGLEINRPDDNQPQDPNDSVSIVVEIASDNQLWMETAALTFALCERISSAYLRKTQKRQ